MLWKYFDSNQVLFGVGMVIFGNIVWRIFCELWVVLFGIHAELASLRYASTPDLMRHPTEEPIRKEIIESRDVIRPREVVAHAEDRAAPRHGVLGLS